MYWVFRLQGPEASTGGGVTALRGSRSTPPPGPPPRKSSVSTILFQKYTKGNRVSIPVSYFKLCQISRSTVKKAQKPKKKIFFLFFLLLFHIFFFFFSLFPNKWEISFCFPNCILDKVCHAVTFTSTGPSNTWRLLWIGGGVIDCTPSLTKYIKAREVHNKGGGQTSGHLWSIFLTIVLI